MSTELPPPATNLVLLLVLQSLREGRPVCAKLRGGEALPAKQGWRRLSEVRCARSAGSTPLDPSGPCSRARFRLASSPLATMLESPSSTKRASPPGRGASLRSAPTFTLLPSRNSRGLAPLLRERPRPLRGRSRPRFSGGRVTHARTQRLTLLRFYTRELPIAEKGVSHHAVSLSHALFPLEGGGVMYSSRNPSP